MVQIEYTSEHKPPLNEHTSPIRNTPEKLSSVLNNRTLRNITIYWTRTNETPLTL